MKIAIFLPNWLGDLVMATPTLRAVRRHFADARIVGILRPYLTDVLAGTHWFDELWPHHHRAKAPEQRHWALVRRLRQERFDMALLLPNSMRTALVARLGGVRQRVGYARYGRGPLLTQKLHVPKSNGCFVERPIVETYLGIAEAVGCPPETPKLELATVDADERSADGVWKALGLRGDRVIALNSGSSNGQARFWPVEHFGKLASRIAGELDHDVLIMCGPKERDLARQVAAQAKNPRVVSMADQPMDFGTAKACIRRCQMMISTDSGPRHVAAALGKPVVTLYGPTLPLWSANPTVVAVDIQLDLECANCQNRVCPLGHHKCMSDLKPDRVFGEVARLLHNKKARTAFAA